MMFFNNDEMQLYCLGLLCGKIPPIIMNCLNPTITTTVGSVSNIPIIFSEIDSQEIIYLTQKSIAWSQQDWDAFEASWDFKSIR